MDKKHLFILVGILSAMMFILIYGAQKNKLDVSDINKTSVLEASEKSGNISDHIKGKKDAKVIIVEYADFQCPACATEAPKMKNIVEKYSDKIAFVFRSFPLPGHTNAKAASAVAEAAGKQDKFWEMSYLLYENQSEWTNLTDKRDAKFEEYAQKLNLNIDQFKKDLTSDEINQKIKFDTALANSEKITETPTFKINGEKIDPEIWSDDAKMINLIESKLK